MCHGNKILMEFELNGGKMDSYPVTPRTNSAPAYNYSNPPKEEKTAGAMPQANEDELPF